MTSRRPLVIQDGLISEIFSGDSAIAGQSDTDLVAGSGLQGGGAISSDPTMDLSLAPNASGLITTAAGLGTDGYALRTADTAYASGVAGIETSNVSLASGNAALFTATSALASGNAALTILPQLGVAESATQQYTAAGPVISGCPVGLDDNGRVQTVSREIVGNNSLSYAPNVTAFVGNNYPYRSTVAIPNTDKVIYVFYGNSGYPTAQVSQIIGTSGVNGTPNVLLSVAGSQHCLNYNPAHDTYFFNYQYTTPPNYYLYATNLVVSGLDVYQRGPWRLLYSAPSASYNTPTTAIDPVRSQAFIGLKSYVSSVGGSGYGILCNLTASDVTSVAQKIYSSGTVQTTYAQSVVFDQVNDKYVMFTGRLELPYKGSAYVIEPSGSTFNSYGPFVYQDNGELPTYVDAVVDPLTNKIIVAHNSYTSYSGYAAVGEVSGTTISFQPPITFTPSGNFYYASIAYDDVSKKYLVASSNNNQNGVISILSPSGNTIESDQTFSKFTISSFPDNIYLFYLRNINKAVPFFRGRATNNLNFSVPSGGVYDLTYVPSINGAPNVLGVAASTVSSGSICSVDIPGSVTQIPEGNLQVGRVYYANPEASGVTLTSTKPPTWNGQVDWAPVGRAISSGELAVLKTI